MKTEEKLKTYKEGFRDGFDEGYKRGREDGNLLNPYKNVPHPAPMEDWVSCHVCGRTGITGVVCSVPNCPTRATATGAVGSDYLNKVPVSSNGAAGY
jgi:hypothetical protein